MLFFLLGQPGMIAAVALYMLKAHPEIAAIHVVIGTSLAGLVTALLFLGGRQVLLERQLGTLEILAASPAPLFVAMSGKIAGSVLFALISAALSWALAAWGFGYQVTVADPLGFIVSALLAIVALWAIGMVLAPLCFVWPDVNLLLSGMEYPIFVLGGFLVPVGLLPGWMRVASLAFPPYWAATALHGSGSGSLVPGELITSWIVLGLTAGLFLACAGMVFRWTLATARRQGRLGWT
jgi:ABC-2 type transport system permease protein